MPDSGSTHFTKNSQFDIIFGSHEDGTKSSGHGSGDSADSKKKGGHGGSFHDGLQSNNLWYVSICLFYIPY